MLSAANTQGLLGLYLNSQRRIASVLDFACCPSSPRADDVPWSSSSISISGSHSRGRKTSMREKRMTLSSCYYRSCAWSSFTQRSAVSGLRNEKAHSADLGCSAGAREFQHGEGNTLISLKLEWQRTNTQCPSPVENRVTIAIWKLATPKCY